MDNAGQLVSATRFAELTGVSRERLRTWERRHGFPVPRRVAGGPRRYALADAQRVLAVRRAVETGVPIPAAIAGTAFADAPRVSAAALCAAVEHAPLPVLLLSGPSPLRVEYANAALRAARPRPLAGRDLVAELPAFGADAVAGRLRELCTGAARATELEHPAWSGAPRRIARSVAYRLPAEPGERPLLAMASLEAGGERAARETVAELERETAVLLRRDERHTRWLEAATAVTQALQLDPGPAVLDHAADVLVDHLNARDATVATAVAGEIVVPRSRRGLLRPGMVNLAAHPELARHLRAATPLWLEGATAAALGVPARLHAACAPILVGGVALGVLLAIFDEPAEIGDEERQLLTIVSAALGFALLRDRLARELRDSPEDDEAGGPR